jgi:acyl-CoA reductase-like NAD-dependent aldehyde dehydrogenase
MPQDFWSEILYHAVIVLEDADIDAAASAIAFGAWFHQGQICMTTGRILAQNKIVAALTEKLALGPCFLPDPPNAHDWTVQPLLAVRAGIPQRALDRLSYG